MTLKDFREMPGLISRKRFLQVTGVDHRVLNELVRDGEVKVWRRVVKANLSGQVRGVYARYYTVEAARLCGFDLNK